MLVAAAAGEIVERLLGNADDVSVDELGPFTRAVFRVLEAAFPFDHRPAGKIVARELGEDADEIHAAVSQGTEASGAFKTV